MIKTWSGQIQKLILARKLGISRVRVNQIVSLLKLDKQVIEIIEQLGRSNEIENYYRTTFTKLSKGIT